MSRRGRGREEGVRGGERRTERRGRRGRRAEQREGGARDKDS